MEYRVEILMIGMARGSFDAGNRIYCIAIYWENKAGIKETLNYEIGIKNIKNNIGKGE